MEPEKKSNGAFIGLVIIIIVLVIGGIYIWRKNEETKRILQERAEAIMREDAAQLEALLLEAQNTDSGIGIDTSKVD